MIGLNKESRDYCYCLGRIVACVEITNQCNIASRVYNNAKTALAYQLREALTKSTHNVHKEIIEVAEVVLSKELPSRVLTAIDKNGTYWIGYYHEMQYLQKKYNGLFGNIKTTVIRHSPEIIKSNIISKPIADLLRCKD